MRDTARAKAFRFMRSASIARLSGDYRGARACLSRSEGWRRVEQAERDYFARLNIKVGLWWLATIWPERAKPHEKAKNERRF